jgi:hypothetical protein
MGFVEWAQAATIVSALAAFTGLQALWTPARSIASTPCLIGWTRDAITSCCEITASG